MRRVWPPLLYFLTAFSLALVAGCAKRAPTEASGDEMATCEGCHLSKALLQATASVEVSVLTVKTARGGDGTVSPLEVWEKVAVGRGFLKGLHGRKGCVACHGGKEGAGTKDELHTGMVAYPSDGSGTKNVCSPCHEDIDVRHARSLHGTQSGYLYAILRRSGATAVDANAQAMFDKQCSSCHTSCGQCHVSRPRAVGGGLIWTHEVHRTPSQTDNCIACHGSGAGAEYRGQYPGIEADTHYQRGMTCLACHSKEELHGDGQTYNNRYDVASMPSCRDCHPEVTTQDTVVYHQYMADKVQCQVCHSQPYTNCYSCHVGREQKGLRFPSELDFRIGRNPRQSAKRPWDYVVLRHIPIAPDSYDAWGVTLSQYTSCPTWVYASPHNIQRLTPQTGYGKRCDTCHGKKDYFLTPEYIQQKVDEGVMVAEEVEANQPVVVTQPSGTRLVGF